MTITQPTNGWDALIVCVIAVCAAVCFCYWLWNDTH